VSAKGHRHRDGGFSRCVLLRPATDSAVCSASSELHVKLAAFVQQFVYRPDRGLLAAHPANGGQQPQLGVDYLRSRMPMMTGKTTVRPVDVPAMTDGDKH
jgi:hypothetical protein